MATINVDRDVPGIFFALLMDLKRKPFLDSGKPAMTEGEWTRWLALADHLGRWYWDLPGVPAMDDISEGIAIDAMTVTVADAISDSVVALEEVARTLAASIAELRATKPPVVSEPAPNIPIPFPPAAVAPIVEALHELDAATEWPEQARALDRAVELARPLPIVEPQTSANGVAAFIDEPFGSLQAVATSQPAVQELEESSSSDEALTGPPPPPPPAARPAKAPRPPRGREVGAATAEPAPPPDRATERVDGSDRAPTSPSDPVPERVWPVPLPANPAAEDFAPTFEQRRAEAARKKAAEAWAERHPGEPSQRPLTPRMIETLDAFRAAKGNGADAARALGLSGSGGIVALIQTLRAEGRLPADIDALLEARKAERAGAKG